MVSDLLYHQAEFDDYVELLRLEYRRKRNFMKLLDGMGYIRHLWQVAVSSSIGLQSRIQIAYKDGARVVPSDPKTLLTEEEYLAIERGAEFRSEFHGGEMYAMVGASRRHNRIVTNLVTALDNQLRDRPCNVYSNDMRVRVTTTGLFTYPDVVVTCGEEAFAGDEQDTLLNPLVIFEVLSDSTEAYDRGKKFEHYQNIDSLSTYVLVAQKAQRIERYVRHEGGRAWIYTEAPEANAMVGIEAIRCDLRLEDVYAKV